MRVIRRSGLLPWAPPLVAAAVVAAVITVPNLPAGAAPPPRLPATTVPSVLDLLRHPRTDGMTGTVRAVSHLGLPPLPVGTGGLIGTFGTVLTGTHTIRVWERGADHIRLAVVGQLAETDFVRNGADIRTYDSTTDQATTVTVPLGILTIPGGQALSLLTRFLPAFADLGRDTAVSVGAPRRIAGRDAYTLVLRPKTAGSLVGSVQLAVDAQNGGLLGLRIYSSTSPAPAYQADFTHVSFRAPPTGRFTLDTGDEPAGPSPAQNPGAGRPPTQYGTVGASWTTVLTLRGGRLSHSQTEQLRAIGARIDGGYLLRTALLTALITDRGTILLGAVPPATIRKAAGL